MTPKPISSIVIVGSGNVAEALARTLSRSPFELRQIFARNAVRGPEVAQIGRTEWSSDPAELAVADLYLIAVSDRVVVPTAAQLRIPAGAVIAHTAGCVPIEELPEGISRAVLYPLQTFTQGREVDFSEIPLFIEASDPETRARIETFARTLSRAVFPADSDLRARIHLSGVLACNFANHLFACGMEVLRNAGLPGELLAPLIRETTNKALAEADPAAVQTGPAVRGDIHTQQRHLTLLDDQTLQTIYQLISKHIWETSKKI